MRYDDLSALSPVVRKEVLSGELNRRIRQMNAVEPEQLDAVVDSIVALALSDVVQGIQDPTRLMEQIEVVKNNLNRSKRSSPAKSPSPSASQDSQGQDLAPNATASAPDHPSTPLSMPATLSTPPRTESPSGSVAPASERDRMAAAVSRLESTQTAELTDLLMSLPKRERALCLFNVEVLRAKIADAKMVLEVDDCDEEEPAKIPEPPVTPQARKISTPLDMSPQTPDLSSRGPSTNASPAPATPSHSMTTTATTHTIASLARLPAAEIVKLASSSSATGLPLPKADPLVVKATDEFMDSLQDKPVQQQKQALGDKMCVFLPCVPAPLLTVRTSFRMVKTYGIKSAVRRFDLLSGRKRLMHCSHSPRSRSRFSTEKSCVRWRMFSTVTQACSKRRRILPRLA